MSRNWSLILFLAVALGPVGAWANCPAIPSQCPNGVNNSVSTNTLQNFGATLNLVNTLPTPQINWHNNITGNYGPSGLPSTNLISVDSDTAIQNGPGDANAALGLNYSYGCLVQAGCPAQGGRYGLRVNDSVYSLNTHANGAIFPYHVGGEIRTTVFGNLGGATHNAPWGSQYAFNTLSILDPGATHIAANVGWEHDGQASYGSDAANEIGINLQQLGSDWGNIGYNDGLTGRTGIWFTSQGPLCDLTSSASALATCGQQLPGQDRFISLGSSWPGDANSSLIGMTFQVGQNTNSCSDCGAGSSGSPPHGGAAIPAAIRRPPTLGHGVDLHQVNFVNDAWFTPGFKVLGNGELDIGAASIAPTDTTYGLTLDIKGQYVSAVVPTGGVGTVVKNVGEQMFDSFGGIYQVTSVNGSSFPTGYSIIRAGHTQGIPACSSNCSIQGAGAPERVNYTWTAPTRMKINPTGNDVDLPFARFSTSGGVQFSANIQCLSCDYIVSDQRSIFFYDSAHTSKIYTDASDNLAYAGTDAAGLGHVVWSYRNNQAYSASWPTPFVLAQTTVFNMPFYTAATNITAGTCGTSPNVNAGSSDNSGYINVGTGVTTSCTINFPFTHPKAPYCVANVIKAGTPIAIAQSSFSTTSVTFVSASDMAGGNLFWHCI